MIAIIDYGMGNLRSVAKALENLGAEIKITSSPKVITSAQGVVLPGVGAMPDAMKALVKEKLVKPIEKVISADKPFLGICLGLQLLFETSKEGGGSKGLGIFAGSVPRFVFSKPRTANDERLTALKVPHMGWNQIKQTDSRWQMADSSKNILSGIEDNSYVYFVHSYYAKPKDRTLVATTTDYGIEFCSSIARGNLFACQFHPEKSQKVGLRILKNFVAQCK